MGSNIKRKLVEFDFLSEPTKKKNRVPLKQMNKNESNNISEEKKLGSKKKATISKKEKIEKEKTEKKKIEKVENEKIENKILENKKSVKEKLKKEKIENKKRTKNKKEKNDLSNVNFEELEKSSVELNEQKKNKKKINKVKLEKVVVKKKYKSVIPDNLTFAKNFCVGINLLDDDLVENALLGQLNWKEVFKQDRASQKKNQELFTQLLKTKKIFKKRNSNSNTVCLRNNFKTENLPNWDIENFSNQKLLYFMSKQVLYSNMYIYQNLSFKNHLPASKNEIEMICNLVENLNLNTKSSDKIRFPLKCLSCSFTTTSAKKFFIHMSYHNNKCNLCSKSFKNVLSYFTHINRHLKNIKSDSSIKLDFRCKHCYSYFKEENQLSDHFFLFYFKHDGTGNKFICKICSFSGNNYQDFKEHSLNNHCFISCPFCKIFLNNLDELEKHTHIHHNLYSNFFQCDLCTKKFSFKKTLEKHYKLDHCIISGKNFRKCYICSFNFTGLRVVKIIEHLANHCDIFLYNCELCELKTNSENEMYDHTLKVNCDKNLVALGNKIDLSYLWFKLAKLVKVIESDFIITDQLNDAIVSIL